MDVTVSSGVMQDEHSAHVDMDTARWSLFARRRHRAPGRKHRWSRWLEARRSLDTANTNGTPRTSRDHVPALVVSEPGAHDEARAPHAVSLTWDATHATQTLAPLTDVAVDVHADMDKSPPVLTVSLVAPPAAT